MSGRKFTQFPNPLAPVMKDHFSSLAEDPFGGFPLDGRIRHALGGACPMTCADCKQQRHAGNPMH